MRAFAVLTAVSVAVSVASPSFAQKPVTPNGVWQSPGGNTRIRIAKCGQNICGKVAWASPQAKADAARGGHPNLIGMNLFEDFGRTGPAEFRGRVFVPDINRRFNGTLTVQDAKTIVVRGCLLRNTGCRRETWTRVGK